MTNVLDGGWDSTPNAITITIPLSVEMFQRDANALVLADFVAGVAARLARDEYITRYVTQEKARTEEELTKAQQEARAAEAWRIHREWKLDNGIHAVTVDFIPQRPALVQDVPVMTAGQAAEQHQLSLLSEEGDG